MDIRPDDINLGAIPFSHSYGFSNLVMPLLIQGTAVVVSNDYLPLSLIGLATAHRCTVAPLIPMVFDHLASLPARRRRFRNRPHVPLRGRAAAAVDVAPIPRALRRSDIHSFYGCSECRRNHLRPPGGAVERGTVGAAMDG